MPNQADLNYEATLQFSEPLLRRVVFSFWRRTVGIGFLVILLLMASCVVLGYFSYELDWLVGMFLGACATMVVLGALFVVMIFVVHYRHTLGRFRQMGSPHAALRVDADTFTVSSDLGTSTIAWRGVQELWRFPDFWLLMLSRAQFVTLPLAEIPSDMQQFIEQQVAGAGGKVR